MTAAAGTRWVEVDTTMDDDRANHLLGHGWQLLSVAQDPNATPWYVLGRPEGVEPAPERSVPAAADEPF